MTGSANFDLDDARVCGAEANEVVTISWRNDDPLPGLIHLSQSHRCGGELLRFRVGAIGHRLAANQNGHGRRRVRVGAL